MKIYPIVICIFLLSITGCTTTDHKIEITTVDELVDYLDKNPINDVIIPIKESSEYNPYLKATKNIVFFIEFEPDVNVHLQKKKISFEDDFDYEEIGIKSGFRAEITEFESEIPYETMFDFIEDEKGYPRYEGDFDLNQSVKCYQYQSMSDCFFGIGKFLFFIRSDNEDILTMKSIISYLYDNFEFN